MRRHPVLRRWGRRRYDGAMTNLLTAALPATATVAPTTDLHLLPAGLTEDDTARISAAIAPPAPSPPAPSTPAPGGSGHAGAPPAASRRCPVTRAALCAYLTERADAGLAIGTLDLACTAIRHVHRMHGINDPVADETVRQVRRGLRRTYGAAPRRLARPLSVDDIRPIVGAIDRSTPDRHPRRRDHPARLRLRHAPRRDHRAHPRRPRDTGPPACCSPSASPRPTKKPTARPSRSPTATTPSPTRSPPSPPGVTFVATAPGALFTRLWRSTVSLEPLSGNAPARMLRARAQAAGSGRHPDHRPLPARRPRHRRRPRRRPTGSDRSPDPAQGPLRVGQPLHPAARGPRDHLQQGPWAVGRSLRGGGLPAVGHDPGLEIFVALLSHLLEPVAEGARDVSTLPGVVPHGDGQAFRAVCRVLRPHVEREIGAQD